MALPPKEPGFLTPGRLKIATAAGVVLILGMTVALLKHAPPSETRPVVVQKVTPPVENPAPAAVRPPVHTAQTAASKQPPAALPPKVLAPPPQLGGKPELIIGTLAGTLRVQVPDTPKGERLPLEHTCYRKNQSPGFSWSGAPSATKSLVAILERRQAGKAPAWIWLLYDIDPHTGSLGGGVPREAQLAGGARHARNIYNKAEYAGPCEPRGQIPYALRVFALDDKPDLPAGASRDDLVRAMNGHIIDAVDYPMIHYLRF